MIFQPHDNSKAMTLSGNASGMSGTVYASAAALSESGNAQSSTHPSIVDTLSISGNGLANGLTLDSPVGTVAYSPGADPLGVRPDQRVAGRHGSDHRDCRCL